VWPSDHRHVGVREHDAERNTPWVALHGTRHRVGAGDVPFIRGLVLNGSSALGVADQEHGELADLHRRRIDLGLAVLVERHSKRVESEAVDIRAAPERDEDAIGHHRHVACRDANAAPFAGRVGFVTQMDAKLSAEDLEKGLLYALVAQPGDCRLGIERGHRAAEARERLSDLDPHRAQPHDGQALGERRLLEEGVRREQSIGERVPLLGHDGARAGGKDDAIGAELLAVHLDAMGIEQAGAAAHRALAELVGDLTGFVRVHVADLAHARQHGGEIHTEPVGARHAEFCEIEAAMEGVGSLDQRLRRHAPDPCAHRAPRAVVDDDELLRVLSDFAERPQPGAARAEDGDIDVLHGCRHVSSTPRARRERARRTRRRSPARRAPSGSCGCRSALPMRRAMRARLAD
jgi:hypothetical protein